MIRCVTMAVIVMLVIVMGVNERVSVFQEY